MKFADISILCPASAITWAWGVKVCALKRHKQASFGILIIFLRAPLGKVREEAPGKQLNKSHNLAREWK